MLKWLLHSTKFSDKKGLKKWWPSPRSCRTYHLLLSAQKWCLFGFYVIWKVFSYKTLRFSSKLIFTNNTTRKCVYIENKPTNLFRQIKWNPIIDQLKTNYWTLIIKITKKHTVPQSFQKFLRFQLPHTSIQVINSS